MNKLQKAIAKLPKEHKATFGLLMVRLLARDFLGLNITKLKGQKDIYRLRHGKLRIIFQIRNDELLVLQLGLRSEKTYRDF